MSHFLYSVIHDGSFRFGLVRLLIVFWGILFTGAVVCNWDRFR